MPHASFEGLRVLTLESRRAREVQKLIHTYNGEPTVVPAMREIPLESNTECLEFGRRLLDGEFDLIFFFTGIGVTKMLETLETKYDREQILGELRKRRIIARGVKPASALKLLEIPVVATVPEPSTWRDALALLDTTYGEQLAGFRVAVQEYGASNPEFLSELSSRVAELTKVPVYQWALPLDLEPLRAIVRGLVAGEFDVVLFMTAIQVIHLFQVAADVNLRTELEQALRGVVIVSVGPTTSEELRHYGLQPDFEPSKPRMGIMINEAAQYAGRLLHGKQDALAIREAEVVPQVEPSTPAMAGFLPGLHVAHTEKPDALFEMASRIVNFARHILPCDACLLYTVEPDCLILRDGSNRRLPLGEGIIGWVVKHREPLALFDGALDDARLSPAVDLPEHHCEAMLCVPLLVGSRVVGVLSLRHHGVRNYSEDELSLMAEFGRIAGAALAG